MWVRKRLDIGWADLIAGISYCLFKERTDKRLKLQEKLESHWALGNQANRNHAKGFISFSVRTAFDLYLQVLNITKGSEVLLGAITIPDIIRILQKHDLIPIPVDIDCRTLQPQLSILEKALSNKSRILLITHLYGDYFDIQPYLEFAQKNNLLLIEDCAQAFTTLNGYLGHDEADISFFSFGGIKTQTALGGALCRIKDSVISQRMQELQLTYPIQPQWKYLTKVLKYSMLKLVSAYPLYGLLVRLLKRTGKNYDQQITRLIRGFRGGDFFQKIRQRSAPALKKMLDRRLIPPNATSLDQRIKKGRFVDQLLKSSVERPGSDATDKGYWLYPVITANPGKVISILAQNGFDATQGSDQLTWVKVPAAISSDRASFLDPIESRRALMHTVYLPVYPEMDDGELSRMARLLEQSACSLEDDGFLGLGKDRANIKNFPFGRGKLPNPKQIRLRTISGLKKNHFDVLVVGGGINGAGVAREAALRGLSVALIEKNDYASGASSNSAKLVHGGYRYLESFQIGLVAESCHSRNIQMKLNPNLVKPLPFVLPLYGKSVVKHAWLDLGLWMYDVIGRFKSFKLHRRVNRQKTIELVPQIKNDTLKGSLVYYDGKADDARLTLHNIFDAQRNGAAALNYAEIKDVSFHKNNDMIKVRVLDNLDKQCFTVSAKHLVYAGGALGSDLPFFPKEILNPTKGIHIIISKARLKLDTALILKSPDDGRYIYCVPFHNIILIGTTESNFDPVHEKLTAGRGEVLYLLRAIQDYFPELKLTEDDIHCTIAGLRPLLNHSSEKTKLSKILNSQKLSWVNKKNLIDQRRDYRIFSDERGITIAVGGKLTTYRNLAHKVMDSIIKKTDAQEKIRNGYTLSSILPLDFGLNSFQNSSTATPHRKHLIEYYGSGYLWIEDRMRSHPSEQRQIIDGLEFVYAEISYLLFAESAVHLDDVLIRRTGIFHRATDQGLCVCHEVARHMAVILEENEWWVNNEVHRYRKIVNLNREWKTPPTQYI
ncbi:FAD-dependent oxidoreductase [Thermodesulfobacteriota bacterium]